MFLVNHTLALPTQLISSKLEIEWRVWRMHRKKETPACTTTLCLARHARREARGGALISEEARSNDWENRGTRTKD